MLRATAYYHNMTFEIQYFFFTQSRTLRKRIVKNPTSTISLHQTAKLDYEATNQIVIINHDIIIEQFQICNTVESFGLSLKSLKNELV